MFSLDNLILVVRALVILLLVVVFLLRPFKFFRRRENKTTRRVIFHPSGHGESKESLELWGHESGEFEYL